MPPEECLAWIHGIGAGVAYLHDRGIVHRDLKPGNIFCDEGVVKVGDYGLSKFISCSRRSGHTESIGTVHYMAPEVANGRYGKEIDVYAMGVILYELLTGRVPFEGESIGEVLMKHLTAKPDVSMLAEPYRSVVARALEKDPALRYRSAAEMLAALPPAGGGVEVFNIKPRPVVANDGATNGRGFVPDAPTAGHCPPAIDESVIAAESVREEPILHAVRETVGKACRAWDEAKLNPTLKILILFAGLFVVVAHGGILLVPLAVVLGVMYGAYWLVWMLLGGGTPNGREPATPGAKNVAAAARCAPPVGRSRGLLGRREKSVPAMLLRTPRQRLAELLGSLLLSALAAAVMCFVMAMIESFQANSPGFPRPEQFAWLLMVSVTGSWAVLILSKFWEGSRGDPMVRRFLMMVTGLGVGAAAFAASELLMVSLPAAAGYPQPPAYRLPPSFYAIDGRPMLLAHMACFATLFLLVRWWLQTNPLRLARLSLGRLILSALVAGVVAWAWQFPQPWLPMVAATISVSVQLSSPWMHPGRR